MLDKKFTILIISLICLALILSIINLNTGYIDLNWKAFLSTSTHSSIANLRINRVVVMLLAGISIPTSGFLLQEYFQNPLAGPSVLGITSAASLSVAFYLFASHDWMINSFINNGMISLVSIMGSLILMFILISFSRRNTDTTYLIIFGFLIAAMSGAVVSILQLYADNQSLKNYVLWSYGANANVNRTQIYILLFLVFIGVLISFKTIKPLIGSALGVDYAKTLGVDSQKLKLFMIIASSILSASITAYIGPILFIGIVVPHFCRMIFNPAKLWQQWMLNMLFGIAIMQGFSILSEKFQLPINILTSIIGIPIIFIMMLGSKKSSS